MASPRQAVRAARLAVILMAVLGASATAAEDSADCPQPAARLVSLFGDVEHAESPDYAWRPVELDLLVCPGERIRTGAASRAAVIFLDTETILRINQNTVLQIRAPRRPESSLISLLTGAIQFFSRTPRGLTVETPFVNAAVEGTEFLIRVADDAATVTVFDGRVEASNAAGAATLSGGQSVIATAGQPPRATVTVRRRDSIQWALYYPPVLSAEDALKATSPVAEAAHLLAAGQAGAARAALRDAPVTARVLALRSVIAVAMNEKEEALTAAREALATDGDSLAARLALSYALQADFRLDEARAVMLQAVRRQPRDALAWARLAELGLALGYSDEALDAASKAAEIAPNISRMNSVLGFSALSQASPAEAASAFDRAIRLDSQDPLPRLGLGLAKVRTGELSAGRREIEIAAALDPGASLIRSYLGKAYFEEWSDVLREGRIAGFFDERRLDQSATELATAKELDPYDPTPWFYDALRKQARNDPIGALKDLETSIDLNDNRAVYRSRLMLDEDLAVRTAGLGRIYNDLGFSQLALNQGAASVSQDPANFSAHRFLSDTYAGLPRHEISRVSELLQAQLLQPVNASPMQPKSTETDLNIAAEVGAAVPAFNEFTPLFLRDGIRGTASGAIGSNGTRSEEVTVTALSGPVSMSAGQFHYETDGFRPNNDLSHDIYNLFGQLELTEKLDVQLEYRKRTTIQGDLGLSFDPSDFSERDRRQLVTDSIRAGARYFLSPSLAVLGSVIASDLRERKDEFTPVVDAHSDLEQDGIQGEGQLIYRADSFNAVVGGGAYDINEKLTTADDISPIFGGVCPFPTCVVEDETESDVDQFNLYGYVNSTLPDPVIWTVGFSADSLRRGALDIDEINPKFGVQWRITPSLRVRAAWFKAVKRTLLVDQSLEPTTIAGFNQFFDDINGTESERLGVGLDARLASDLSAGLELSRRWLEKPLILQDQSVIFEDQRETLLRGYVYWTPTDRIGVRIEPALERFARDADVATTDPTRVVTASVPVGVQYFHPSGFFSEIGVTFVRQEVDLSAISTFPRNHDSFALVDLSIGYRLPRRLGVLSLQVLNLTNEDFLYQDDDFRTNESRSPPFAPDRTVLARLVLHL